MAKYITLDNLGLFLEQLKSKYSATTNTFGGVKLFAAKRDTDLARSITTGQTTSSRYYGVELDKNDKAFVNVPWTDTNDKVKQTVTSTNANYPLLLAPSGQTDTNNGDRAYFDSGVTLNPSTNILSGAKTYESLLQWGNSVVVNGLSPVDAAMDGQWSANRLSFMPASGINIEYSTDGGTTWTDYGLTDPEKQKFVTTGFSCPLYLGKNTTRQKINTDRVRVTITAECEKTYFRLKKIYMYITQSGANDCKVIIEKSQCGSDTTFTQVGEYSLFGWPNWNSIPLTAYFGGADGQTSNIRKLRFTYYFTTYSERYGETDDKLAVKLTISKLNMIGESSWDNSGGNLPATGHLYSWDINKNATFPANVTATTFIGSLSGTATIATNVNILTSSSNTSYPLLFTSNVTAGDKRIYTDSENNLSYNPSTNELSTSGDIKFKAGNNDKYIKFASDAKLNSWRIGYLGSGSGDGNYLTFESNQSTTDTFVKALQISNVNLTSTFSGDILPSADNNKSLGSSSLKWSNVYATYFKGNADTATTSDTIKYHQNSSDNDDVNKCHETGKLKLFKLNRSDAVNGKYYAGSRKIDNSPISYGFPVTNHANSLLWVGTYNTDGKDYGHQLGFSSDGNIYHRHIIYGEFPTTANGGSWNKLVLSNELSNYATTDSIKDFIKAGDVDTKISTALTGYATTDSIKDFITDSEVDTKINEALEGYSPAGAEEPTIINSSSSWSTALAANSTTILSSTSLTTVEIKFATPSTDKLTTYILMFKSTGSTRLIYPTGTSTSNPKILWANGDAPCSTGQTLVSGVYEFALTYIPGINVYTGSFAKY